MTSLPMALGGCTYCFKTQSADNKYCKYNVSWEYRILTFLVRQDSNQMQVEEGGREESDVKCLARRWVFTSCCEWRCSPGRGGKVSPSFGSLEGEKSRQSESHNRLAAGEADWGNIHMNHTRTRTHVSRRTITFNSWYLDILVCPAAGRLKSKSTISHFLFTLQMEDKELKSHFPGAQLLSQGQEDNI